MARLFVFSLNYSPEPTGFAPHSAAMAEHFARRGHDVVVFTGFPFAPYWRRAEGHGRALTATEHADGVTVRRFAHFIPRRPSSAIQRCLMEATFSLAALIAVIPTLFSRRRRPDAVLYVGAQPMIAMLTRLVSLVARCPYYVNINDLAVQAAFDVGILKPNWLGRTLERFEFGAYVKAAGAAVVCGSFRDILIARGYPKDRIRLLRSPVDLETVRPVPRTPAFRARHGIPDDAFVLLWAGSMGKKQDLHTVLAGADRARGSRLFFVLVGDGESKVDLEQEAATLELGGVVRFVRFQPLSMLSDVFAAADVLLLNQVRTVKDSAIPSKLLNYMAAGKPVLAAVNERSQAAEILRDAVGGLMVVPEDPAALVDGARQLAAMPAAQLAEFGRRNRDYAERHFDQARIFAAYEEMVFRDSEQAASGHSLIPGSLDGADGSVTQRHLVK
jgi:colanic acid biosynthesis glycosyl transferase WcaI